MVICRFRTWIWYDRGNFNYDKHILFALVSGVCFQNCLRNFIRANTPLACVAGYSGKQARTVKNELGVLDNHRGRQPFLTEKHQKFVVFSSKEAGPNGATAKLLPRVS